MTPKEDSPLITGGAARSPPPNALKIFRGAAELTKSWKLLCRLLLVGLVLQTLLFVAQYDAAASLVLAVIPRFIAMTDDNLSIEGLIALLQRLVEDLRKFTAVEVAVRVVSFLIMPFFVPAMIIAIAMAAKSDKLAFGVVLWKIMRKWRGFVVTHPYSRRLFLSFGLLWLNLPAVLTFVFGASVVSYVSAAVRLLLGFFLYLYLDAVVYQRSVISLTEERDGLTFLARTTKLICGSRALGFQLVLLKFVIFTVPFISMRVLPTKTTDPWISAPCRAVLFLPLTVVILAVDVVFNHECRKRHGEEEATDESRGLH